MNDSRNQIKVTELKLVEFPSGYTRKYRADDAKHVAWLRRYVMIIPLRGRRGISFATSDFEHGNGDMTPPFSRAALKRCFNLALELGPSEAMHDTRTNLAIRRLGKSKAFEIVMPCGESACLKAAVVKRLIKELE
jgi:hypothetical protein